MVAAPGGKGLEKRKGYEKLPPGAKDAKSVKDAKGCPRGQRMEATPSGKS
jgi:hypothetical protein